MLFLFVTLLPIVLLSSVSGQQQHDSNIDNSEGSFVKDNQVSGKQDAYDLCAGQPSRRSADSHSVNSDADRWVPTAPPLEWRPVLPIKKEKEKPKEQTFERPNQSPVSVIINAPADPETAIADFSPKAKFSRSQNAEPENDDDPNYAPRKPYKIDGVSHDDCSIIKDLGLLGDSSGRRYLAPESRDELIMKLHRHLRINNINENAVTDNIVARQVANKVQTDAVITASPNINAGVNRAFRMNKKTVLRTENNEISDPTKGVGIVPLSSNKLRTLGNSRVCYACSSKNDQTCWKPDRKTTVKYCREGRDSCVTRHYNHSLDASLVVIRDCSNACDSVPIGDMKYLSCSICQHDLCNDHEVYNNSSSTNYLSFVLICIGTGLVKYVF